MTRSAPIAIAAMLALGTTPGLAQTVQADAAPPTTGPILQLPVDPLPQAAPQEQQPTIVLPSDATPAPVPSTRSSAPTTQPAITPLEVAPPTDVSDEPALAPAAKTAKRAAAPIRKASSAASAPAQAASAVQAERVAPSAALAADSVMPTEQAAPMPVAAMPEQAAAADVGTESESDFLALAVLALAGLIPIGFAVFALMWFRRRSRRASAEELAYAETATTEPVDEPVAPVLARKPEPVAYRPEPMNAAPARHPLEGYCGLPTRGAAVALPQELPETIEERDALLKRMIEAEPDKANPFTSRKARAKRARLILQSLGRTFENAKPRFDLSQYTANWPALANRRPGYA